ncbi:MAG: hypothetical protein NVS4B6_29030 [Mycobacterium sp.]
MPVLPDPPRTVEELRQPSGQYYSLARMLYGSWDVPVVSAAELQAEVAVARFQIEGIVDMGHVRSLVARRPE